MTFSCHPPHGRFDGIGWETGTASVKGSGFLLPPWLAELRVPFLSLFVWEHVMQGYPLQTSLSLFGSQHCKPLEPLRVGQVG